MSGKFIVFEGIDGAGKTTQVNLLLERLQNEGKSAYLTAEPTDLPTGRELRRVLSGEVKKSNCEIAALFTLDRIAHNKDAIAGIERVLAAGYDVICDRYYYSTLAYQGFSTDYEWVKSMNVGCPEIRRPDLCIFLDLTPEQSIERITKGREKLEIYENVETLTKVRDAFHKALDDLKKTENIAIINAYRTPEEISEEIWEIYSRL